MISEATTTRAADRYALPHPGMPGSYRVLLQHIRIIRQTELAMLIADFDEPRGQVWVSKANVDVNQYINPVIGPRTVGMPVWLFRKIAGQL